MLCVEAAMTGKYEPLGNHLRDEAATGQHQVELTFGTVDRLVGGLPPSARKLRTWWANNSQGQSLAWRDAGWHVASVDLPEARVVFATGEIGGTYADRGRTPATNRRPSPTRPAPAVIGDLPTLDTVDVAVHVLWRDAGEVTLDGAGKPTFPPSPSAPGLYRLTLNGRPSHVRARVYIGETDNLRRRLSTNYRSPGPRQKTSLRVNAMLREHLSQGGEVALALTSDVTVRLDADDAYQLDLTRKAARLLSESAALVLAQARDDADIENLG